MMTSAVDFLPSAILFPNFEEMRQLLLDEKNRHAPVLTGSDEQFDLPLSMSFPCLFADMDGFLLSFGPDPAACSRSQPP